MAVTKTTTTSSSQSSGSGSSSSSSTPASKSSSPSTSSSKSSSTSSSTAGKPATVNSGVSVSAPTTEKKAVTPLPQVNVQQEQQIQGQGPLALEKELTPGQKVMSAAPWNPNYKGEQTPATKPQDTVEAQQQAAPAESNKPYDFGTLYQNMVKPEDYGQPTEAQLEEERKRNKRNALLATIGDGLAAFHKAYSHARGVKPMELENLSDKMYNRLEKVRKERQANKLAYQNARLRAAGLDQQAQINFERHKDAVDRMAETKRHNEAMENYYANKAEKELQQRKEAKDADREAANQRKAADIASREKMGAASNATRQSVAATQAATRKEIATMKSGGQKGGQKGGQIQDGTVIRNDTTFNSRGRIKNIKHTETLKGGSKGASSSSKGGSKGRKDYSQYEVK